MEDIESPLHQSSEVKIYKDLVRPHHLASIGGNNTVFWSTAGKKRFTNRGTRSFPRVDLVGLIEDVRRNKFLNSVTMPRQWDHQDNINTRVTHQGKIQGGGYASKWGLFRQRPKAYKFRPLCNTGKKGNKIFTREGTADTKSRTPPSSAR